MYTTERVLPAKIEDDGSVHYSSVMSPSDSSVAVCHMVSNHYIPVIFVPGVMGTNLRSKSEPPTPVWMVDSQLKVVADWAGKGSERRKLLLDPQATDVYCGGKLPSSMK